MLTAVKIPGKSTFYPDCFRDVCISEFTSNDKTGKIDFLNPDQSSDFQDILKYPCLIE
jgi:hypothetical protein